MTPDATLSGDSRIEEGRSFVPPSLLNLRQQHAADALRVADIQGSADEPKTADDPAVTAAIAGQESASRGQVRSILEPPDRTSPEDLAAKTALDRSIHHLFRGGGIQDKDIESAMSILFNSEIRKVAKYEVFRGLLKNFMKGFGTARSGGDTIDRFTWIRTDFMEDLLKVLKDFKAYFTAEMPDADFDYFLRIFVGELAVPFYVHNDKREAIWMAESLGERMDMIKRIATEYGTVTPEQLAEYQSRANDTIAKILNQHVGTDFFGTVASNDRERVLGASRKYGIELKSEMDAWREDAAAAVENINKNLTDIDGDLSQKSLYHFQEAKRNIDPLFGKLRSAYTKFGDKILPESVKPLETWIAGVEARIATTVNTFMALEFKELDRRFREDMDGILSGKTKDLDEKGRVVSVFKEFIREATDPVFKEYRPQVVQLSREYFEKINSEISRLALEVAEDPSKAVDHSKRLEMLGMLRSSIDNEIRRLESSIAA